ncbi:hypothetical protein PINS_up006481 [Pythium insidiosum]|nr:hypothetical protein PINS_up006481 [Pythium insidiosum]
MTSDWIFSDAELRSTPSQRDGMKFKEELIMRRKGCDFIEKMSKALDLPKLAQISADYYFHRFYMRQSLVRYDRYLVSAACVLLASKVEESPKKIGYIAKEYISVRKVVEKDSVFAIQKHDQQKMAGRIISMEGVLLHTLAYDLTITHPYKFINEKVDRVVRLQGLSDDEAKRQSGKIKQVAWSFLNDSAYTLACLRLDSNELAAGAVYLAGLYENYVPEDLCAEEGAPWWHVLSTPFHTLQDAATYLLSAYAEPYIDTKVLPAGLSRLVYTFHPPRVSQCASQRAESPNHPAALVEATEGSQCNLIAASPLCVTSPECGNSQSRSPYDHDFDHEVKASMSAEKDAMVSSKLGADGMSRKRTLDVECAASRRVKSCW